MAKNVLVVEDYEDVRTMMKIMVQLYGYNVVEARDGVEAIEKVKQHCPDLILMDIALPGMDGFQTAGLIKASEKCADIPIIAVTAHRDMFAAELAARFDRVFYKPVEMPALTSAIRDLIAA